MKPEWWEDYDPAVDDDSRDPDPDEDADDFHDPLRDHVPDHVDDDPTGLAGLHWAMPRVR